MYNARRKVKTQLSSVPLRTQCCQSYCWTIICSVLRRMPWFRIPTHNSLVHPVIVWTEVRTHLLFNGLINVAIFLRTCLLSLIINTGKIHPVFIYEFCCCKVVSLLIWKTKHFDNFINYKCLTDQSKLVTIVTDQSNPWSSLRITYFSK